MRQHQRKKCLHLCLAVATIFGVTACSDDFSPWELLNAELTSSYNENTEAISCEGGTFTMNLKTNASWTIEAPNWISIDQVSGTGDAIVNVNIPKNEKTDRRTGYILTHFLGSEKDNVAGKEDRSISVTQQASYEIIKIYILKANFIENRLYLSNDKKRWISSYGYHIEYMVETSLSDAELEALTHNNAAFHFNYFVQDGDWDGYTYKWHMKTDYISDMDISKGIHTVEDLNWRPLSYPIWPNEAYFTYNYSDGNATKYVETERTRMTINEN